MTHLPDIETENIIFKSSPNFIQLRSMFKSAAHLNQHGDFSNINWLNTPGPIYTTTTDNCGTGQTEAVNNVSGDKDYCEIIFKQPVNFKELEETISAAICDPFGSYYFDGNQNWNFENIITWYNQSEDRINYIVDRYREELRLPLHQPHICSWKIGNEIFTGQLYGPPKSVPENYKSWLDFYQFGLKNYLEWYVYQLESRKVNLPSLNYDWTIKDELDSYLKRNFLSK